MARARNIKPGFYKDAKVVSCSFPARILFTGLWCLADYMGRLKYEPLEIKMEVFPADDVDVVALMEELSSNGLIKIYREHSGSTLVQVTNFTKHQNPHLNEKVDKDKNPLPCLPGPDESIKENGEEKTNIEQKVKDALVVLREYSKSDPADSLNLIPDSLKNNKPPKPEKPKQKTETDSRCRDSFERFWETVRPKWFGQPGNKQEALKAWGKLNPDDLLAERITRAALRDAEYRRRVNANHEFIPNMKHASGWINNRCWEDVQDNPSPKSEIQAMVDSFKGCI